jgi:HSP20 family molecular chaperone IbpA
MLETKNSQTNKRNMSTRLDTFIFDLLDELSDLKKSSPFTATRNWHSEKIEDRYVLQVSLPGYSKSDINIEVDGNKLVISHKSETENVWKKNFEQKFLIPDAMNKEDIQAKMEDGLLTVSIGKNGNYTRKIKID